MSVNANTALALSNETGFNIDMCKAALERSHQNEKEAKSTIERWVGKTDQKETLIPKGAVYAYYDQAVDAASIVEIKTENTNLIRSTEFAKLVGSVAYQTASFGDHTSCNESKKSLEELYNTKININSLQVKKIEPYSLLTAYTHRQKIGVIVEIKVLNAEAFNRKELRQFAFDCALHIAAFNPVALDKGGVSKYEIAKFIAKIEKELLTAGKEIKLWEPIIMGKLDKWINQRTLLNQIFIRSESSSVRDEMRKLASKISSDIEIVNYVRFSL